MTLYCTASHSTVFCFRAIYYVVSYCGILGNVVPSCIVLYCTGMQLYRVGFRYVMILGIWVQQALLKDSVRQAAHVCVNSSADDPNGCLASNGHFPGRCGFCRGFSSEQSCRDRDPAEALFGFWIRHRGKREHERDLRFHSTAQSRACEACT